MSWHRSAINEVNNFGPRCTQVVELIFEVKKCWLPSFWVKYVDSNFWSLKKIEIFDTGQDDGYLHYQGTKPVWEPPWVLNGFFYRWLVADRGIEV